MRSTAARTASLHLSVEISCAPEVCYRYVSDPAHLPLWAQGFAEGVVFEEGVWLAETSAGRCIVAFAPDNGFGVLDHYVSLPGEEARCNPMRVLALGEGCEVVCTLRGDGRPAEEVEADAALVCSDLERLREILEVSRPG